MVQFNDDSGSESSASGSKRSQSPVNEGSPRSGRSGSASSRSRSGSPQSQRSENSNSPPNSPAKNDENPTRADDDTRSRSPNLQIDDHASNQSRSRSGSRSHSGSRSRSRSQTRSKSGTPQRKSRSSSRSSAGSRSSRSRSKSRSKSKSKSKSRSKSRSRSKSKSRSKSRSRSRSGSRSSSGSPVQKKRRIVSSGSDTENEKDKKDEQGSPSKVKKSRIIDSESENDEMEQTAKVDAQDIFGDADDISASSDDERKSVEKRHSRSRSRSRSRSKSGSPGSRASSARSRSRSRSKSRTPRSRSISPARFLMQAAAEEQEPVPETRIDVEIPRIVTDLGRDIHFVKLPNFLSVDTRPFDTETYEDEIDEEETMDEEGRQRIKLKVSNTIRWREYMNDKGDMVKESNARFVRWSDGSMSLHLGNEIFDVYKQPLHGDHNHMFIRQGTGLQGQAVFRTKLTFRPHSTESFTHKKMTMSLADRSQKTSGIKILTQVGKDPTTDRLYQLKKEEEKLRQAMRSQHRPQVKKKKTDSLNTSGGAGGYQHDDGSDDENAISLSAIKNKYKKGLNPSSSGAGRKGADLKASAIYSSDEDDGSDFEQRRHKKIDKAKAVRALTDSDSDSDTQQAGGNDKSKDSDNDKSGSGSVSEGSGNESGSGKSGGTGSGSGDESE